MIGFVMAAALGFLAPRPASAEELRWHSRLADALAAAKREHKPVLIDFQAPWCYSCYFMEGHVLNQEAFAARARDLVLVKVDVDQAEGQALKEKYRVSFLPSYVLLDERGATLGRIVGEQAEREFLDQLARLAGPKAAGPEDRAVEVLRERLAARDFAAAEKELAGMSVSLSGGLEKRNDWRILKARLALMRALEPGVNLRAMTAPLKVLLAEERSCDLAYDVVFSEKARDGLSPGEKAVLLKAEAAALESLAEEKIFTGECADFRTGLEVLAGVYKEQGRGVERDRLLGRAVAALEKKAAAPGLDRNRDDNLRYFLDLAGDGRRLRELFPKLIAVYPADYVYAYRFAKYLHGAGENAEALGLAEKADKLCYGANRLGVTLLRAKILAALGRSDEARLLLKRDAKAYGKAFPVKSKELEELLASLP